MLLACKLLKKYVYSYIPGAFLPSELKLPLASLRDFFSRIIYKIPDGFITINNKFMEQLKLLTTNKPVYVLENFIKESVPREIRKLDSKKITIGIVGALTKRKNQRFIIEWLAKTKNKDVRVVLFGDGKDFEMLSNLAQKYHVSDRVEFAGWVQDQGIVYSQIDLLVIPSIVEGVPLVMLEAAIRRVPVLATDLAGISDFLPKEMLFIVNDINDFEDKFNTLIQYPEILWAAVENNYQKVISNNLQSNFNAQLELIFNKILTK
jgi:glycosyltransferase involved in cell wall biosynthesis